MSGNYRRKSVEERRQEVESLSQSLVEYVSDEAASGNIQKILDNLSKVTYDYSLNNILLIGMQRPDATVVASYAKWNAVNRQVAAGEKGIAIICPVPYKFRVEVAKQDPQTHEKIIDPNGNEVKEEKEFKGVRFRVGHVFDISQTVQIPGKEEISLDVVKNLTGDVGRQYSDLMYALRISAPVESEIVNISSAANGYFSIDEQKIMVRENMSEQQTMKTMIHETAHAILHNKTNHRDGSLTYYVFDSTKQTFNGINKSNLSFDEAIDLYKAISTDEEHGKKMIGIMVNTKDGIRNAIAVADGQVQMSAISNDNTLRFDLEVQEALNDLCTVFPPDDYSVPTMREVQAEATAYVVAAHYGIDTSEYSVKYITAWSDMNPSVLMANLGAVETCANEIILRMDDVLAAVNKERYEHREYSAADLAEMIDNYAKDYGDWYEYKDAELYPGSNYDNMLSDVLHGRVDGIKSYLQAVISESPGTERAVKAETLICHIDEYEKKHMSESNKLAMPRMKM